MNKIKLIAMDLDGTLSQHKSKLCKENLDALNKLREKYMLLMVGAGNVNRIFAQMDCFPINIIGNYGMQEAEFNPDTGGLRIIRDDKAPCCRESVSERIENLRCKLGFRDFAGDSVEFHDSGVVTFPLLGTAAPLSQKLRFDPDRAKRRRIYEEVKAAFPDYKVFIGGSSSFDFVPRPYNKCYALKKFCLEHGILPEEVICFGDDYGPGGNDECLFKSHFNFIKVDDYRTFPQKITDLV